MIQRYAQFKFSEKGQEIVSSPHFVYDFSEKFFTCCILLIDQISLNDCPYVINFEINLVFLTKSFFYMTKKSRQKFKYIESGKRF